MVKRKRDEPMSLASRDEAPVDMITTIIDPDGDLNLIFRDGDGHSRKKMLVSRHTLCLSSKVFKAMLGVNSQFREATNPTISPDGIQEINLEGDDFQAMTVVMSVIHLQHRNTPKFTTFEQLHEIALICDKYDLTESLGLWPGFWAAQFHTQIEKKGFHGWLLIATVFRQDEAFARITKHIILTSIVDSETGDLVTPEGWELDEGVHPTIMGKRKLG